MNFLSIVIPVYNEAKSLPVLFERINRALQGFDYEIIAVNDGSRDNSFAVLKEICKTDTRLKAINLHRNFGQTAAINAGISNSTGDVIVIMDSDLENDPNDIPRLLEKLNEGYDVVSGWRQDRWKGAFLTRKLPSVLANKLISYISGVPLHDYGCTLKAYRRDVIKDVILYGQMHRFIPVYCAWHGGKVTELRVSYNPRQFGKSNYGIFRTYRVLLDLLLIKFLDKFMQRPIHFFGAAGFISMLVSVLAVLLAIYYKFWGNKSLIQTPLPIIATMFFIIGVQMLLLGIIAEILMRTYYESQHKTTYTIKEKINFE